MGAFLLSKTEIDAMVTVALRWTEHGDVARMPEPARTVLHVTPANATDVGTRLWQPNRDRFPDQELAPYEFEALPGKPGPLIAFRLAEYYEYQVAGDLWEDDPGWNEEPPPFESYFSVALQWYAAVLLGRAERDRVPAFHPEGDHAADLRGDPVYDALPWGFDENDRDIFLTVPGQ